MADEYKYPGKDQIDAAWSYLQPSIDATGDKLKKFSDYISSNWTNSGNIVDPIKYSREAAAELQAIGTSALEDLKKTRPAEVASKGDATVIKEAKLLIVRSRLSEDAQGYFDTLMSGDTLQRILTKHAGEPGIAELSEEVRQNPETVAFALAQNASLGTGRLDWLGDRWLAASKLWEGTTTEMSGGMKSFFDKAENWTLFGFDIGWIFSGVRWLIEAATNLPNMIGTGIKVAKGMFGYDQDFERALAEVQQEGLNSRLTASLNGVGSESFGKEVADILSNPSKARDLPALSTTLPPPAPAPSPASNIPVAAAGAAAATTTTVGSGGADTLKNTPTPSMITLSSAASGPEDFNPDHIKASRMWRDVVLATASAAPFSTAIPGGKLNPRPDITSLSVDPLDRDIARYVSNRTAYESYAELFRANFDPNELPEGSFAKQRYQAYVSILEAKYLNGSKPNDAKTDAHDKALETMQSEYNSFSGLVTTVNANAPAQFHLAANTKEGFVSAAEIKQSNIADISMLTVDELAKDASIAGITAFRKYRNQPELLADKIVTALIDPASNLRDEMISMTMGTGNARYIPSGEPAATNEERLEYAKWMVTHPIDIGEAYDRAISGKDGFIAKARQTFTNGEVYGLKQAIYAAAQKGDLDLSKLSGDLKTLYESTDIFNGTNPDSFSKFAVLSNEDFELLAANKVSFAGIKTPQAVLMARTQATQLDAQILKTAVEYGVFQISTDEIRNAMTTLKENIDEAPKLDGYAPGVKIPSLSTLGTAFQVPPSASLSPEHQAAQVLKQLAMLTEEKQLELLAKRDTVRNQIDAGRSRIELNPASTTIGSTINVANVEAGTPVSPAATGPQTGPAASRDFV